MESKNNFEQRNFMPSAPPSYDEVVAQNQIGPAAPLFVPPAGPVGNPMPMPVAPPACLPSIPLVQTINVGPSRAHLQCPQCSKNIKTFIETSYQKTAHIACFVLCLVGCCLCSCIPYCLDSFKNIHHKCPECKAYIGTYKH